MKQMTDMKAVADDLESRLAFAKRLREMDEQKAAIRSGPDKWSVKETIGHLIDSATNNHQRFIRMQLQDHLELKGYDGDEWVQAGRYQDREWADLVSLWESYNRHLAHVIRGVSSDALKHTWTSPEGKVVDLAFVIHDYIVHMQHHLDQIEGL